MANTIWLIIYGVFAYFLGSAIATYFARKENAEHYDKGYKEGFEQGVAFTEDQHPENKVIEQATDMLDVLFNEDGEEEGYTYGSMYFPPKKKTENNNIFDCGEY